MRDAVRRHDEILRSEIERRRGYVFKTIGDAFCAAFWSVGEALEAAAGAQRQLGRENFADVDELRVRMAIAAARPTNARATISARRSIAWRGCFRPVMAAKSSSPEMPPIS